MEIKQLKYFSEIVRHGSINKASQAIFISQPYLSNVVKELENELDTKLLERHKTGITLTPDGEKLLLHANRLLDDMDNLKASFSPFCRDESSIAISITGFSHIMETFIALCLNNSSYKKFTYVLNESNFATVVDEVKNNTAQVGIVHNDISFSRRYANYLENKNIRYYPLATLSPCILINKNHPVYLKNSEEIDIEDLREYGFVSYTGQTEDFIYSLMIKGSAVNLDKWDKKVYIYGRGTLLHMVERTDFFSIGLNPLDFYKTCYDLAAVPIKDCENRITFGYILRNEGGISPITEEFIGLLKKDFSNMPL